LAQFWPSAHSESEAQSIDSLAICSQPDQKATAEQLINAPHKNRAAALPAAAIALVSMDARCFMVLSSFLRAAADWLRPVNQLKEKRLVSIPAIDDAACWTYENRQKTKNRQRDQGISRLRIFCWKAQAQQWF
jgi:hypothetical protein